MSWIKVWRTLLSSASIVLAASCIDPYAPPLSDKEVNFLVVDGFLNSGNGSAEVKLSQAVPLHSESTSNPISKAIVQIEREDGMKIQLSEAPKGVYSVQSAEIATGSKFQLRVKALNKEYVSDVIELKRSPVLDSVTWVPGAEGVTIYVDSHDVTGSTKYYQWNFIETWEYASDEFSQFIWQNAQMIQRRTGEFIEVCYGTNKSTRVLISTTTSNTLDVVADFPLAFIPRGSKKVSRLYSILVQQRAMDEDAYKFWKDIQRSTENVGGLFDALPGEVAGNIHNVNNPLERVLGYFAGGEVQEKRIFIDWDELPLDLHAVDRLVCEADSIPIRNLNQYIGFPLYVARSWGTPSPIGYIAMPRECLDCRVAGGVLEKPAFWPR